MKAVGQADEGRGRHGTGQRQRRTRTFIAGAGVAALALIATWIVIARAGGGGQPDAVASGTATATNDVAACSRIGGGGGLCHVSIHGDYFGDGLLGNGTYAGALTIDWSTYATTGSGEKCASISGKMTFTSGWSVLKTTVVGASDLSNSEICESLGTAPFVFNRDYFFFESIVSGTGRFKHVVPSESSLAMSGKAYGELNAAQTAATGTYLDQPSIFTSLTVS